MGTGTIPDIDVDPTTFDAAYTDQLVSLKVDRDGNGNARTAYPSSSIVSRFTAGYGNALDDLIRAIQRRLRGEVRVGTYDDTSVDHGAIWTWSAGAARALLRTAGNGAYASLQALQLHLGNGARILDRAGSPEGAETAGRGSVALDTSGGVVYVKTTTSGNTGWVAVGGSSVVARDVTAIDINDTDVESLLANLDIPAGALALNGQVASLDIRGDVFNNGASRNATFRVSLGGTVHWEDVVSLGNVDDRRPMHVHAELIRLTDSSQVLHGSITIGAANSAEPDIGTGGSMTATGLIYPLFTEGLALDESATINWRVSIEHAVASTNMRTRVQSSVLRVE